MSGLSSAVSPAVRARPRHPRRSRRPTARSRAVGCGGRLVDPIRRAHPSMRPSARSAPGGRQACVSVGSSVMSGSSLPIGGGWRARLAVGGTVRRAIATTAAPRSQGRRSRRFGPWCTDWRLDAGTVLVGATRLGVVAATRPGEAGGAAPSLAHPGDRRCPPSGRRRQERSAGVAGSVRAGVVVGDRRDAHVEGQDAVQVEAVGPLVGDLVDDVGGGPGEAQQLVELADLDRVVHRVEEAGGAVDDAAEVRAGRVQQGVDLVGQLRARGRAGARCPAGGRPASG